MSTTIVIEQMLVICLLILTGAFLYKRSYLNDEAVRQISWLVVNVTNPAILLSSAIDEENPIPPGDILLALALSVAAYVLAGLVGALIGRLLRADRVMRVAVIMMTMYGNVGYIGIPLALATLGSRAMFYVTINNLVYSLIFYSTGFQIIRGVAASPAPGERGRMGRRGWRGLLLHLCNVGTACAVFSVLVYLFRPSVPALFADALRYAGRCTTFLSMLVLGVSVASSSLGSIFRDARNWGFVLLRGLAMPLFVTLLLSPFIHSALLRSAVLLMLAVPAGNLPMIVSRELGVDDRPFSRGIILSTLLSPVTIPVVSAAAEALLRGA